MKPLHFTGDSPSIPEELTKHLQKLSWNMADNNYVQSGEWLVGMHSNELHSISSMLCSISSELHSIRNEYAVLAMRWPWPRHIIQELWSNFMHTMGVWLFLSNSFTAGYVHSDSSGCCWLSVGALSLNALLMLALSRSLYMLRVLGTRLVVLDPTPDSSLHKRLKSLSEKLKRI